MPADLSAALRLEVPVIVRLGERMLPTRDVLSLVPGSIIELTKHADEPLDLLVNNRQIGHGTAVKIGENFGVRITAIGGVRDRIEAMGGGPGDAPGTEQTEPEAAPADPALPAQA